MRKLEVVEYDPSWPSLFNSERAVLHRILGHVAVDIHHIGSTAVSGLAAKPIIDILLEVTDVVALDHRTGEMESAGYEAMGECGIPGRRYFRKGGDRRTHHVHAFAQGDSNVTRHLAFRDYLRANPGVAREYEAVKKRLALVCDDDMDRYWAGKDACVKRIERIALEAIAAQQEGATEPTLPGDR